MTSCKIVVIGDGGVGKSCLLISCTTGSFPGDYIPTVFDNYASNIMVDNCVYMVGLWDTAGQEDYDRLRPLSYPGTDVFLLCFDVSRRASFTNVEEKWLPEVKHFAPDTPIILVANKIDERNNEHNNTNGRDVISHEEGQALAAKLGIPTYLECSALTQEGIPLMIPTAIRTAFTGTRQGRRRFWFQGKNIFSSKSKNTADEPQPPVMPPAGLAPWINITTSTFADDFQRLLTDNLSEPDVKFITEADTIHAHQILLASASFIFKEMFLSPKKSNQVPNKYKKIFKEIKWVRNEELSNSSLNNLNIDVEPKLNDTREYAEITLSPNIDCEVFRKVLHFFYTGLPGFAEIEDADFLREVKQTAELFHLQWLTQVCENHLSDERYLNPSIGTWLNDETGSVMKTMFLNKSQLSDVRFSLEEGDVVHSHKAVLMARCDVMAAMLGGGFAESKNSGTCEIKDTKLDSFLAILEYLYTDHAPIEDLDSIDIMVLADRFCLPRLVTLCELYISKKVDKMIQKKVADAVEYVVNLLLLSQAHNATQLSRWCLHFIASNYSVFESLPDFSLLKDENREYVEEHRWPPLSYFRELEEYQSKIEADPKKDNCSVM